MSYHPTLIDGAPPSAQDLDWLLASRALAFGEGVFTSIRVWQGRAVFSEDHLQRLKAGLEVLQVGLPASFWQALEQEMTVQAQQLDEGLLKIMLLAGPGGRGYKRSETAQGWHRVLRLLPMQVVQPAYQGIPCWWMPYPGKRPALAHKHLNRLTQVLASEFCPEPFQEALLFNDQGYAMEGIARNLFWYQQGQWFTPALQTGALEGVLRKQLLKQSPVTELEEAGLATLQQAEEVFLCNSVQGIWPVVELQDASGVLARWPRGEATLELMQQLHPALGLPTA